MVTFVELAPFTRQVDDCLTDEEYGEFQMFLAANPEAGDIIRATGGCRKVRWAIAGKGKSGGVRVIYLLRTKAGQILLIAIYKKVAKGNLTDRERAAIRKLVEEIENG